MLTYDLRTPPLPELGLKKYFAWLQSTSQRKFFGESGVWFARTAFARPRQYDLPLSLIKGHFITCSAATWQGMMASDVGAMEWTKGACRSVCLTRNVAHMQSARYILRRWQVRGHVNLADSFNAKCKQLPNERVKSVICKSELNNLISWDLQVCSFNRLTWDVLVHKRIRRPLSWFS